MPTQEPPTIVGGSFPIMDIEAYEVILPATVRRTVTLGSDNTWPTREDG